jgi:hypothetical protein
MRTVIKTKANFEIKRGGRTKVRLVRLDSDDIEVSCSGSLSHEDLQSMLNWANYDTGLSLLAANSSLIGMTKQQVIETAIYFGYAASDAESAYAEANPESTKKEKPVVVHKNTAGPAHDQFVCGPAGILGVEPRQWRKIPKYLRCNKCDAAK